MITINGAKVIYKTVIAPDPRLKRYRWIGEGESWQMGQDWTDSPTRETPEEVYARWLRKIDRFGRNGR